MGSSTGSYIVAFFLQTARQKYRMTVIVLATSAKMSPCNRKMPKDSPLLDEVYSYLAYTGWFNMRQKQTLKVWVAQTEDLGASHSKWRTCLFECLQTKNSSYICKRVRTKNGSQSLKEVPQHSQAIMDCWDDRVAGIVGYGHTHGTKWDGLSSHESYPTFCASTAC